MGFTQVIKNHGGASGPVMVKIFPNNPNIVGPTKKVFYFLEPQRLANSEFITILLWGWLVMMGYG